MLDLVFRDGNRMALGYSYLSSVALDRLVILDEIHRMPEIFETLRGVIDKGRRKNKGKGRFLTRYVDLLCDLLLVRRLPPLIANVGKRLVKSPKVYVRDSGLVHALLGLESLTQLSGHPVVEV